jgi:uncharacterized protein YdeI (YjbR/CyaY-like superfamily)
MGKRDPGVDAYIARAADFAQPVLSHLRDVIHEACPDVEESLKWSAPHFTYKGMLCHFAAFRQHCAFGFWKGELVVGEAGTKNAAGQFGRIASLGDLPSKAVLTSFIHRAMALNEAGVPAPRTTRTKGAAPVEVPPELAKAFRTHKDAAAKFKALRPSHQREYAEWVAEAKRDETRQKRVMQTIEQLEAGQSRHGKYEKSASRS